METNMMFTHFEWMNLLLELAKRDPAQCWDSVKKIILGKKNILYI
jgi:hypothetical protein